MSELNLDEDSSFDFDPDAEDAINFMDHLAFIPDHELDLYLTKDIDEHICGNDPI